MMRKRIRLLTVCLVMAVACSGAVCARAEETVTLKVAGPWEDFIALEVVANKFTQQYPECVVEYEFLQDYYASLEKRLVGTDDVIDLFVTTNVQEDSPLLPYALELYGASGIDLSGTFDGLIHNFEYRGADPAKLYAVPLGAELRGMFVNTTLLDSLGLAVPTTLSELMEDCRVLKENGYVPLMGNPGMFAQQFMYPWIASIVANADDPQAVFEAVNTRQDGISELFRAPMAALYAFMENGYYNYKYVETELNMFTRTENSSYANYFMNVLETEDGWEKKGDIGMAAFMAAPMSLTNQIDQTKEDYHSQIEYTFILSPVSEDGGFAYMSPAHGIGVNAASGNLEWAERFMTYLFTPENNELFSQYQNIIPNVREAFSLIEKRFDVPENQICHVGQVTFNYGFYDQIVSSLIDVSKGNNPKYMDADGAKLYPLEYYMQVLEARLTGKE